MKEPAGSSFLLAASTPEFEDSRQEQQTGLEAALRLIWSIEVGALDFTVCETLDPKPETLYPKPESLNPKPYTLVVHFGSSKIAN